MQAALAGWQRSSEEETVRRTRWWRSAVVGALVTFARTGNAALAVAASTTQENLGLRAALGVISILAIILFWATIRYRPAIAFEAAVASRGGRRFSTETVISESGSSLFLMRVFANVPRTMTSWLPRRAP